MATRCSRPGRAVAEYKTHGLPKVQTPPKKSQVGTKNIENAVNEVLFDRLGPDPQPSRD
ncbi:MAG: hypothetical protein SGI92_19380 [Bryobacteraceae bacterium]|nr:hypothetical protein [Bryobacteraceae bacterium]